MMAAAGFFQHNKKKGVGEGKMGMRNSPAETDSRLPRRRRGDGEDDARRLKRYFLCLPPPRQIRGRSTQEGGSVVSLPLLPHQPPLLLFSQPPPRAPARTQPQTPLESLPALSPTPHAAAASPPPPPSLSLYRATQALWHSSSLECVFPQVFFFSFRRNSLLRF